MLKKLNIPAGTEYVRVSLTAELAAKLKKVCKKRGLRFPQDLNILLKEVDQPAAPRKSTRKTAVDKAKSGK